MASSIDTLEFVAPEFSGLSDSTKETALEMAAQRLDPPTWGRLYEQAAAYLAAHLLKLRDRSQQLSQTGGGTGGIRSIKTGDLSVSFQGSGSNASTMTEEALGSTEYGQQYLSLRDRLAAGAGFVADG